MARRVREAERQRRRRAERTPEQREAWRQYLSEWRARNPEKVLAQRQRSNPPVFCRVPDDWRRGCRKCGESAENWYPPSTRCRHK